MVLIRSLKKKKKINNCRKKVKNQNLTFYFVKTN